MKFYTAKAIVQTCRRLQDVIQASIQLQYNLELFAQGMVDIRTNRNYSLEKKLELLRKHERIWTHIKPSKFSTIPMPLDETLHCFQAGTLLARLVHERLGPNAGRQYVEFNVLPSKFRTEGYESSWIREVEPSADTFTMDPAQDLLITVGFPIDELVPSLSSSWKLSPKFYSTRLTKSRS